MKYVFFFFFLFTGMMCSAQNVDLLYDAAGNQTVRGICLSCNKATTVSKEITELKNEDFQKDIASDLVSYYPNPVIEQLYLKWNLVGDKKVTGVDVYSLGGQKLNSFGNLEQKETQIIDFYNYPSGNYLVIINYSDSDKKTLNIIKN